MECDVRSMGEVAAMDLGGGGVVGLCLWSGGFGWLVDVGGPGVVDWWMWVVSEWLI